MKDNKVVESVKKREMKPEKENGILAEFIFNLQKSCPLSDIKEIIKDISLKPNVKVEYSRATQWSGEFTEGIIEVILPTMKDVDDLYAYIKAQAFVREVTVEIKEWEDVS